MQEIENALTGCEAAAKLERDAIRKRSSEINTNGKQQTEIEVENEV